MPQIVYALHSFSPENDDEVAFKAGEMIEVLDRDDLYGDGWWTGRNTVTNQTGLFPQSYTAPAPGADPSAPFGVPGPGGDGAEKEAGAGSGSGTESDGPRASGELTPLQEVSESGTPPAILVNGSSSSGSAAQNGLGAGAGAHGKEKSVSSLNGEELPTASMTDVQRAIESLGRRPGGASSHVSREDLGEDGERRSFSFRSDRESVSSLDYANEESEVGHGETQGDDQGWHKGARERLAEKARRAVQEAEKLEAMMGGKPIPERTLAPPIEVEMSDESEDEDEEDPGHAGYSASDLSRLTRHVDPQYPDSEDDAFSPSDREEGDEFDADAGDEEEGDYTQSTFASKRSHKHHSVIPEESEEDDDVRSSLGLRARERQQLQHRLMEEAESESPAVASSDLHYAGRRDGDSIGEEEEEQPGTAKRETFGDVGGILPEGGIAKAVEEEERGLGQGQDVMIPPSTVPSSLPTSPHTGDAVTAPSTPSFVVQQQQQPPQQYQEGRSRTASPYLSPLAEKRASAEKRGSGMSLGQGLKEDALRVERTSSPLANTLASATTPPGVVEVLNAAPAESRGAGAGEVEGEKEKGRGKEKPTLSTKPPHEWELEEVVAWVRVKGFGEDVVDKFVEQEITGDVLLDLDAPTLKSEIGIVAFGKRVRIANAITELRRPPSISSPGFPPTGNAFAPGNEPLTPAHSQFSGAGRQHERNISASHSYPGSGGASAVSEPLGDEKRLNLSPSDAAGGAATDVEDAAAPEDIKASHSMRRKLFGRSHDSSASKEKDKEKDEHASTHAHPAPDPLVALAPSISLSKEKSSKSGKHKKKASVDANAAAGGKSSLESKGSSAGTGGKGNTTGVGLREGSRKGTGERSSIFGNAFGHGKEKEGKGKRKEVPRYSTAPGEDGTVAEKQGSNAPSESKSTFSLNMLYTGRGKSSSGIPQSQSASTMFNEKSGGGSRPTTPQPAPKTSPTERRDPALLRKRTSSFPQPGREGQANKDKDKEGGGKEAGKDGRLKQGVPVLEQIGEAEYSGWMRKKGDRYNSWKMRYFVLKGCHLYILRDDSRSETKIKGYINIFGYKVTVDENVNPGKYGFRIDHETDKTHYFSSDEKAVVRGWMKAIMKATIGRDYSRPVISSVNIPTIPLVVAQTMNPAPRPPSPTQREATQKSYRRENPNQLSSRDARVLMGLPSSSDGPGERQRLDSFFTNYSVNSGDSTTLGGDSSLNTPIGTTGFATPTQSQMASPVPVSPGREKMAMMQAQQQQQTQTQAPPRPTRRGSIRSVNTLTAVDNELVDWANGHLPSNLQISIPESANTPVPVTGLHLLRLAEAIKGRPSSPAVPDSAFPSPSDPNDDKLDGLFRLFDFLLDNDVKMGSVSINDVRQGRKEKIVQLLNALKDWERKRMVIAQSLGAGGMNRGTIGSAGGFMGTMGQLQMIA